MNQEEKRLLQKFEKEIWLFLDKNLPESRIKFWNQKIEEYSELKKYLDEYISLSEIYVTETNVDIPSARFNKMIDEAIRKDDYWGNLKGYFSKLFSNESEFVFGKIAFASALIIAAIFISIINNKTNPITNATNILNSKVLDWEADFVDDQISKVGTLLKLTKDEEYRKYYKYNLRTKSVDKNINLINGNIETLKEEINNKEL